MCNEHEFLKRMRKGIRQRHLLNMIDKLKELLHTGEGVNNFENISRRIEELENELSCYYLYE